MEVPQTRSMRVADGGLRAEASWCESLAGTLVGSVPVEVGPSLLASAAAVKTANVAVAAAGARCVKRMQATAAALTRAANGYTENEATSEATMRAVATTRAC